MERREFLKMSAAVAASAKGAGAQPRRLRSSNDKPTFILVIADQRHYGMSKATGYPLDTSPTLERMQDHGIGFERNYCTAPAWVPSRISMLTGRWPEARRARMNPQQLSKQSFWRSWRCGVFAARTACRSGAIANIKPSELRPSTNGTRPIVMAWHRDHLRRKWRKGRTNLLRS